MIWAFLESVEPKDNIILDLENVYHGQLQLKIIVASSQSDLFWICSHPCVFIFFIATELWPAWRPW